MQITFALAKGRLAKKTLKLLEKIGITPVGINTDSRKLIFFSEDMKYRFFLSKPVDVPTYVDYGIADIGIVGKDTILEEDRDLYECLDLDFAKCKIVVAGYPDKKNFLDSGSIIKVATKYPNIAKNYFLKQKRAVEIVKLNGSVELGPLIGLADVIVDIVESGKTLKENGLVILEEIQDLSARVIVNKASIKVKYKQINKILSDLEELL